MPIRKAIRPVGVIALTWLFLPPAGCGPAGGAPRDESGPLPPPAVVRLPPEPGTLPDGESIVLAQRKRVLGRLRSLEQIRRVSARIRPLVERAAADPAHAARFAALAARDRVAPDRYRREFVDLQEADLLLESGGDPDARSVSNAVGVAQFLAGTARRRGLKVNLSESNRLSRKITQLERALGFLEAQPPEWSRTGPDGTPWPRDRWLSKRRAEREALRAQRRRVDERFDPEKAIRAQTRYLLELDRRFGGLDWALQAYHGGEAGAVRTMTLFRRARPRGNLASRGPSGGGFAAYEELYRLVSPRETPEAFRYLFGRSDDHRYYWWKVRMARIALSRHREDPAALEEEWRSLQPGHPSDAAFYPDPEPLRFADAEALRAGYRSGALAALPANAAELGLRVLPGAPPEGLGDPLHRGLRPEAMAALLRLARIYRDQGGRAALTLAGMVRSRDAVLRAAEADPPPPPRPGYPPELDFDSTGLVFQLLLPEGKGDRQVLEYALGALFDRRRIGWRIREAPGPRRYHVVVNPEFREEMTAYLRRATAAE